MSGTTGAVSPAIIVTPVYSYIEFAASIFTGNITETTTDNATTTAIACLNFFIRHLLILSSHYSKFITL